MTARIPNLCSCQTVVAEVLKHMADQSKRWTQSHKDIYKLVVDIKKKGIKRLLLTIASYMEDYCTNKSIEYIGDDYVHSANSLFHFVTKAQYLYDDLKRKALCPRYCNEDIGYLNINYNGVPFSEISVLQKCFCDIPLHTIIKPFPMKLTDNNKHITEEQRKSIPNHCSHVELYGQYALAFSKSWGERSKLQPIHYLSNGSDYIKNYSDMLRTVLEEEDIPDVVADTLLHLICYFKPLRGTMWRSATSEKIGNFEYEVFKNFHDEHEWRYVPFSNTEGKNKYDPVIANVNLVKASYNMNMMNDRIRDIAYQHVWLRFTYDDIRYIIVPNINERIEAIRVIDSLNDSLFSKGDIELQKQVLISKILVLDEIKRDF